MNCGVGLQFSRAKLHISSILVFRYRDGGHHRRPPESRITLPFDGLQVSRVGDFVCKANKMLQEFHFDPLQTDLFLERMKNQYTFDVGDVAQRLSVKNCGELDKSIFAGSCTKHVRHFTCPQRTPCIERPGGKDGKHNFYHTFEFT